MKLFNLGITSLGALTLATGLFGCADESHWGSSSKEKGSISISLTTNSDIATAKPIFRSEDEENADDAINLSTYCDVPSPEDFSIKLEKNTTGEVSTWSSLSAFKEHIANNTFDTGTYTLTAYYGEKGKQDFEAPYFEASTTFNVLSDQDNEVNLTAELKNSMVKINYTDGFKDYMKDYHTKIRTEGLGEPIIYGTLETRPVFIEPNNATLSVHFTTKAKEITSSLSLDAFAPLAKTLHNITFDISENASSEEATLTVTFDDTLEDEDINIDLTDELLTTPAPVITCEGFENGATLDLLELLEQLKSGERSVKMIANASDKIQSAIMTIESTNYVPSWGYVIDLCKATTDQQTGIKNAGIKATNFGFDGKETDLIATLDLTEFGTGDLKKGNHKVSLVVTDSKGKTSETASVTFDNQDISLELIGNPSIVYASNKAELTFDYNGLNPMEDIHFYEGETRVMPLSVKPSSFEQTGTRASEKKRYLITLPLTNTVKSVVAITASHKGTNSLGNFTIPVTIPEYKIEAYDAFSQYAYVKISTTDPSFLSAVTENIKFKGNGNSLSIIERNQEAGIIKINGLSPASEYTVTSSLFENEGWSNNDGSFTTETESPVPNGDFEDIAETINTTIDQGGKWTITAAGKTHQTTLSMTIKEPQGWISSNSLTCNLNDAKNKNSWYVIPSVYNTTLSWVSHQPEAKALGIGQSPYDSTADIYKDLNSQSKNNAMVIRNVAWDLNGPSIDDNKQTGNSDHSNYYCNKKPSSIANRTAGYLYLGSASKEGADFSSRPAKLKGFYKYENDSQDNAEKGKVTVEILNGDKSLGCGQIELGAANDYTEFVVPIEYGSTLFQPKATTLKIYITSSNKTSEITTTDYCNKEECCSRGAALTIDNLTFEY